MHYTIKITKGNEVLIDHIVNSATIPEKYLTLVELVANTKMVIERLN